MKHSGPHLFLTLVTGIILPVAAIVVESLSRVRLFHHPNDCSPSDSSVRGILQAKILKWVAISFSRGASQPGTELTSFAHYLPLSHQGSPYFPGRWPKHFTSPKVITQA